MGTQSSAKTFTLLVVLSCLVPMAVLGAVFFLNAPVWPASLIGLIILALLARRIFALLSEPGHDESSTPNDLARRTGQASYDHRPR